MSYQSWSKTAAVVYLLSTVTDWRWLRRVEVWARRRAAGQEGSEDV